MTLEYEKRVWLMIIRVVVTFLITVILVLHLPRWLGLPIAMDYEVFSIAINNPSHSMESTRYRDRVTSFSARVLSNVETETIAHWEDYEISFIVAELKVAGESDNIFIIELIEEMEVPEIGSTINLTGRVIGALASPSHRETLGPHSGPLWTQFFGLMPYVRRTGSICLSAIDIDRDIGIWGSIYGYLHIRAIEIELTE